MLCFFASLARGRLSGAGGPASTNFDKLAAFAPVENRKGNKAKVLALIERKFLRVIIGKSPCEDRVCGECEHVMKFFLIIN